MQRSLREIGDERDNFRAYTAVGEHHCVLKHTAFYAEVTDGVRLRDWVTNLAEQVEVETVLP